MHVAQNRAKFKLNTPRRSNESFQDVKVFINAAKSSTFKTLKWTKWGAQSRSVRQEIMIMPQRALKEITHAHTALFYHLDSWNALNNISKGWISLQMSYTSWLQLTVHNTCKSTLEGSHTHGESVLLKTSSDRCCERPFRRTLTGTDLKSFQMNGTVTMSYLMFNLKERRVKQKYLYPSLWEKAEECLLLTLKCVFLSSLLLIFSEDGLWLFDFP